MNKEIKLQAKKLFLQNYKVFKLPILLYVFSNVIIYAVLNVSASYDFFSGWEICIRFILFVILELIITPITKILLCKAGVVVLRNCNEKKVFAKAFLKGENLVKIVLINFIPCITGVIYTLSDVVKTYLYYSNAIIITSFLLLLLKYYLDYKFFICNYFFASNETAVKKTINTSFKIMKKKFFKYLLLDFSFIHFELLIVGIYIVVVMSARMLNIGSSFSGILLPFGFGINFYLIPYKYMSFAIFAKELLNRETSD